MAVTVYTKPDCKQCELTKRYLESRGVAFQVQDLREAGNLAAAKALGHLAAPVVVFAPDGAGTEVSWSGFRPDMLDTVAKRAILPSDATREARSPAR